MPDHRIARGTSRTGSFISSLAEQTSSKLSTRLISIRSWDGSSKAQSNPSGEKAAVRTYSNLLKTPYDGDLFEFMATSQLAEINLDGEVTPLGKAGMYRGYEASPDGKYLWFLSNRSYEPIMGRVDQNHVFLDLARPYLVLLQDGVRSPFDPAADTAEPEKKKGKKDDEDEGKTPDVAIDLDGIQGRIVAAKDCDAGNWFRLEAIDGGALMLRRDEPVFLKYQNVNDRTTDTDLALFHYALGEDEPEEECKVSGSIR